MFGWLIMRMICSSRFLNRLSCSTFLMATCRAQGRGMQSETAVRQQHSVPCYGDPGNAAARCSCVRLAACAQLY